MTCGICGKELRNAKSRELGYGPVCYRKAFGAPSKNSAPVRVREEKGSDSHDDRIPGQMEIDDFLLVE